MKIRKLSIIFIAWLIRLLAVMPAQANPLCGWFGYCVYESPAFRITVVDQETGQPLADVHAMAEWVQYGSHGTNGPLMVQDAVSGPNGVLAFAAWGPMRGSNAGLVLNQDPVITLFKPGYNTLLINNAPGTDERGRVRGLTQDGQTFKMEPFRGTIEGWVEELKKAAYPGLGRTSEDQLLQFRISFLNRMQRVWTELQKVPRDRREIENFIRAFEDDLQRMQHLHNKG